MEAILTSFHLNPQKVSNVLLSTNGIIAGSAALSAVKPSFTPNDLDIWVEIKSNNLETYNNYYEEFLIKSGYVLNSIKYNSENTLYNSMSTIYNIKQYDHPSGKTIQVIFIASSPIYNMSKFDFNICRIYYDGVGLYSDYMNDIANGVFQYLLDTPMTDKNHARMEKYIARGFVYKGSPNLKN